MYSQSFHSPVGLATPSLCTWWSRPPVRKRAPVEDLFSPLPQFQASVSSQDFFCLISLKFLSKHAHLFLLPKPLGDLMARLRW